MSDDDQLGQAVFDQAMDFWVRPEIERRQREKQLARDFRLVKAQVIFEVDAAPVVRLNDEVVADAKFEVGRSIQAGEAVMADDITAVRSIKLTDTDPNAGHITMVRTRDGWGLAFSFRYNRRRIEDHAQSAREFLDTAKFAMEQENWGPFVENLFGAVELMAKGSLMELPDRNLLTSKKHSYVASRYNLHGDGRYTRLLNELSQMRPKAPRYQPGTVPLDRAKAEEMLTTAEEMYVSVSSRL